MYYDYKEIKYWKNEIYSLDNIKFDEISRNLVVNKVGHLYP